MYSQASRGLPSFRHAPFHLHTQPIAKTQAKTQAVPPQRHFPLSTIPITTPTKSKTTTNPQHKRLSNCTVHITGRATRIKQLFLPNHMYPPLHLFLLFLLLLTIPISPVQGELTETKWDGWWPGTTSNPNIDWFSTSTTTLSPPTSVTSLIKPYEGSAYSYSWTGYLIFPLSRTFEFNMTSDDNSAFYTHDNTLLPLPELNDPMDGFPFDANALLLIDNMDRFPSLPSLSSYVYSPATPVQSSPFFVPLTRKTSPKADGKGCVTSRTSRYCNGEEEEEKGKSVFLPNGCNRKAYSPIARRIH